MRVYTIPATLLLLLCVDALQTSRRRSKEKQPTVNICDISDRDSKVHCYCETSQELNTATKTECWVFNGGIERTDPLWSNFISQTNVETLAFNVRADGGLSFIPKRAFKYLRRLKKFSVKYGSIKEIESHAFSNLTTIQEMTLTKNQIQKLERCSFFNLPNLTVLTMDENRIEELQTDTFYLMPSLEKLYLTSNNISTIHPGAFRHLVNLIDLELDRNNLSDLKKECFDGLANLRRLDMRRNKISVLNSFTFTELWNLQDLFLDYNDIYILAQRTFDGLSQLRKLSLSNNKLVSLAPGLFEGVRGLSSLDLRRNSLRRFTYENLRPIYDNLKNSNSNIYLDGNNLDCNCHLTWIHRLRNEAKSVRVRTSLENFICKYSTKSSTQHLTYFEHDSVNSPEANDIVSIDHDDDEEFEATAKTVAADEKILLQIPVELLPCPQDAKTVTDRTYTHPSQNEVKDYRNYLFSSSSNLVCNQVFLLNVLVIGVISN